MALTQYLMRYAIVEPLLAVYRMHLQLPDLWFFILVMATVCVGASGYVINDYFDTRTDLVNKPNRVVVGKYISRRSAMAIHVVFSLAATILGTLVSMRIGLPILGIIFLMITGILWFYSTSYKRQAFLGNIIVAFLTAMVPFMVLLFEIPLLRKTYLIELKLLHIQLSILWIWVSVFAAFAFLMSLIREMIKDCEDIEGDIIHERKTLPIQWGIKWVKALVISLSVLSLIFLTWLVYSYIFDIYSVVYIFVAVFLPWIYMTIICSKATTPAQFRKASMWCKVTMLTGIGYSLVARYIIMSQL
jgi:4-hydroxybenzoate polyprenyltransferase